MLISFCLVQSKDGEIYLKTFNPLIVICTRHTPNFMNSASLSLSYEYIYLLQISLLLIEHYY